MKAKITAGVLALTLVAGAAQAMTVQEFLTTANGIPRNPTALLRSDPRRLTGEFRSALQTVYREQIAATAAGRRPATCIPERISISADDVLARFNAIPAERRSISTTQAVREWMAQKYPCPA